MISNDYITNITIILIIIIFAVIYFWYISIDTNIITNKYQEFAKDLIENKKYKNFTILDFFKYSAKHKSNRIALKIKNGKNWKNITYKSYYKNCENFAKSINYWLGEKINVAISGFNSTGWVYSHFGCMMNGGSPVGLYSTLSPTICKHIIYESNCEILVVEDTDQLKKFVGIDISPIKLIVYYSPIKSGLVEKFSVPVFSMGNFMSHIKELTHSGSKLSDQASIIYTSGTTKKYPKGVVITHENIMASLIGIIKLITEKSYIENFGINEQFISHLPLNDMIIQIMDMYLPIITAGTVWFADKVILKTDIINLLKTVNPTIFYGYPKTWEKIKINLENNKSYNIITKTLSSWKILQESGLSKTKLCLFGSDHMSIITQKYFESIGLNIYQIYGSVETTGIISMSLKGLSKYDSVGAPIMNVKIGENREILVKGKNLFKKYVGQNKRKDEWFNTGDIGIIDNDGFLYIIGRKEHIITMENMEQINPIPIENHLYEQLGIYFDNIIITKNKKNYLTLLLNTSIDLPDNIEQLIETSINSLNSVTIKKWKILNKKFKVNEEFTPNFKLRRIYI